MRNSFFIILSLLTLMACPAVQSEGTAPAVAEDTISQGPRRIPLVVITLDFPVARSVTTLRNNSYYELMYTKHDGNSVIEYLEDISYGNFSYDFIGVLGPYTIENNKNFDSYHVFSEAMQAMENEGFDFASLDADRNGVLNQNEILFVTIDNGSLYDGAMRNGFYRTQDDILIDTSFVAHGSVASVFMAAHEITHLLGTVDLYGSDCNSYRTTLMSCAGYINGPRKHIFVSMDPWHKIQLDWIEPRYHSVISDSPGCYTLEAVQYNGTGATEEQRPIVVYERSSQQYFIVEFRNPLMENSGRNYDRSVPYAGVVIWTIKLSADNLPLNLDLRNDGTQEATIWNYSPDNNFGSFLWPAGSVTPTYQDNIVANFTIQIGDFGAYSRKVEICIESI